MLLGNIWGLLQETPVEATGALLLTIERVIENLALIIEILAVAIIVSGTIIATFTYARRLLGREAGLEGYERYPDLSKLVAGGGDRTYMAVAD